MQYWAFRLNELFNFDSEECFWQIDFGLIYSGSIRNTGAVICSTVSLKENFSQVAIKVKEKFGELQIKTADREIRPYFIKNIQIKDGAGLWKQYIKSLNIVVGL